MCGHGHFFIVSIFLSGKKSRVLVNLSLFPGQLEQSAEAENRLKLEQKRSVGVIEGLNSEKTELENIVSYLLLLFYLQQPFKIGYCFVRLIVAYFLRDTHWLLTSPQVSKHVEEKRELAKIMKSNMKEKEGLVNEVNQLKNQVSSLASQVRHCWLSLG